MDFINNIEISIPAYSFIVNRINKKKFVIVEKQSTFKCNSCNNKAICELYSTLTIKNHKTTSFMLIWGLRCQFWTDFTDCLVFSLETLNKYFFRIGNVMYSPLAESNWFELELISNQLIGFFIQKQPSDVLCEERSCLTI